MADDQNKHLALSNLLRDVYKDVEWNPTEETKAKFREYVAERLEEHARRNWQ